MPAYSISKTWEQESWVEEGKNGRRRRRRRVARGAYALAGSGGEGYQTSEDEGLSRKTEPRYPGVVSWIDLGVSHILTMPSTSDPPAADELAAGSLPKKPPVVLSLSSVSSTSSLMDPANASTITSTSSATTPAEVPEAAAATTSTAETEATATGTPMPIPMQMPASDPTCQGCAEGKMGMGSSSYIASATTTPTTHADEVPSVLVPMPMMLPMPNTSGTVVNGAMYALVVPAAPYQAQGPR